MFWSITQQLVNSFVTSVQRFVSAAYLELKIQTDKPVLAHTNSPENKLRKQKMSFPVFAFVYSSSAPALLWGGGGDKLICQMQIPHPRDPLKSNTAQDLINHNEEVSLIIIFTAVRLFTRASMLPSFICFNATYQ